MFESIAATPAGGDILSWSPALIGPLAAFVLILFVTETVVSGKTYRRTLEENKRLSEAHTKALTVAQSMVESVRAQNVAIEEVVSALNTVARTLAAARNPEAANNVQHQQDRR